MMTFLPLRQSEEKPMGSSGRPLSHHGEQPRKLCHQRSGRLRLATVCSDSDIQLWGVNSSDRPRISRTIGKRHEHGYMIMSIAFSPDGTLIAAGLYDSTIRIFRVQDGVCVDTLSGKHKDAVRSVTFGGGDVAGGNRRLLSGSWDGTIHLWTLPNYDTPLVPRAEEGGGHNRYARKRKFVEK